MSIDTNTTPSSDSSQSSGTPQESRTGQRPSSPPRPGGGYRGDRRSGGPSNGGGPGGGRKRFFRKKVCFFCSNKVSECDYKDIDLLKKFITDRGKILPRRITGTCAKHQRMVASEIRKARIVALLPFEDK